MRKRLSLLLINYLLISAINTAWSQETQAVAELLTPDTDFCENGTLNIQIRFGDSYEAPFDAVLKIYDINTGVTVEESELITGYFPTDHDNNYIYQTDKQIDYPSRSNLRIIISEAADRNNRYFYNPESDRIKGETLVNLYRTPTGYSAGADQDLCGLSTELEATLGGAHTAHYWEPVEGLSYTDPQSVNTQLSAIAPGTYNLVFVQENGPCVVTDAMELILKGQPQAQLFSDSEICGSGQAEFTATLQGNGPWSLDLSDGSTIENVTESVHPFSREVQGHTLLQINSVRDVHSCQSTYAGEEETVAEVVDLTPVVGVVSGEAEVCGNQLSLELDAYPGTGSWSLLPGSAGTASFANENAPETLVSVDTQGSYAFRWTQNNKGCEKQADFTGTFYFPLQPEDFTAGPDTILYNKSQYKLQATLPEGAEGLWSIEGSGDVLQPDHPHSEITGLVPGTTHLEWKVKLGNCAPVFAQTSIELKGLQNFTGISPNGDGKNDYLEIPGAQTITNNELLVFDQQGKMVFRQRNYQNDWAGTDLQEKPLPEGYYYYLFTGENTHIKDYLIIKRTHR